MMSTVRQERSSARLLLRVVGLSTATIPLTGPIGVIVTGLLIDALGLQDTLMVMTGCAALVGAAVLRSAGVRALDRLPSTDFGNRVEEPPARRQTATCTPCGRMAPG